MPDDLAIIGKLRRIVLRGGEGSGHYGHKGRPGEVGGSQASPTGPREDLPKGPRPLAAMRDTMRAQMKPATEIGPGCKMLLDPARTGGVTLPRLAADMRRWANDFGRRTGIAPTHLAITNDPVAYRFMMVGDETLMEVEHSYEHDPAGAVAALAQSMERAAGSYAPDSRLLFFRTDLPNYDEEFVFYHEVGHWATMTNSTTWPEVVPSATWLVANRQDPDRADTPDWLRQEYAADLMAWQAKGTLEGTEPRDGASWRPDGHDRQECQKLLDRARRESAPVVRSLFDEEMIFVILPNGCGVQVGEEELPTIPVDAVIDPVWLWARGQAQIEGVTLIAIDSIAPDWGTAAKHMTGILPVEPADGILALPETMGAGPATEPLVMPKAQPLPEVGA